jgi:hypothetical protein
MLKWISKSGAFIQFTLFLVFLAILWIPAFVKPVSPVLTIGDGPLYRLIAGWLLPFPSFTIAIALFLVVLQSVLLFYMFQANGYFGRSNFLPAIIILLAFSWNADFQTIHSVLFAGIFIIIALNSIMAMYGRQGAFQQVFTAAFSIGIAALFYIPLTYLLLFLLFSLITYRISTWREYVISLIGFFLPFIYYLSWLFWNKSTLLGFSQLGISLFNLVLPARFSIMNMVWLSVSAIVLLISLLAVLNALSDKLISLRRKAWILIDYSFTALIVVFLAGWPIISANYLFIIPMAFFITGSISLVKRAFWFEMISLAYFLLLVGMRVYHML